MIPTPKPEPERFRATRGTRGDLRIPSLVATLLGAVLVLAYLGSTEVPGHDGHDGNAMLLALGRFACGGLSLVALVFSLGWLVVLAPSRRE